MRRQSTTRLRVTENVDYFEMLLDKNKDASGNLYIDDEDLKKIKAAYDSAHDIRKFEISLYWQRTTFLWGFMPVLITGFGFCFISFFSKEATDFSRSVYSIFLLTTSLLGLMFSGSWRLMLQSSKFWQENWELSIAVLEKYITGNLHKIHFHRIKKPYIRYSIHKIMLSLMNRVFIVWGVLVIASFLIFANLNLELLNFDTPYDLIQIQIVIYSLGLLYPVFEIIYRIYDMLSNHSLPRKRDLNPDDICIVLDNITVKKEQ
ncbi:hypothetical protein [Pantoea sp. DY-17]|uniref:RipA family octameric membrane protein n=1 Tax=Pantoea sp. DY-17 TaxID=2871490 RepID=UPI001C93F885|nr:hypothetical protein [Pantoea sp. DY-17]MBY4951222.1 hypothetical protein [Pantoea sp. DY-17]